MDKVETCYWVKILLANNLVARSADVVTLAMKLMDYRNCDAHHLQSERTPPC